ncbi:hypothetical protein K435DRAFT_974807 [Dendrothele bispora CBS 962.96]|uniref:Uncharacterized protein n=1 Tax=Dendrothele bispora (strain CBS 962.96) TaxID=1314807 RepID=A0A4V4HAH3_DENBC|nr:hypothetical protein K435DRAFT_974807 [Dendrothele bispora CBS 962.96]
MSLLVFCPALRMDALVGIGHACGRNLIAIAGVATACAIKAVLEQFDLAGKVQLLGIPGLKNVSSRPRSKSVHLSQQLAVKEFDAEYFGHIAHAALSPREGINALDAAVLAYNNVNALCQQLKRNIRVHGVSEGKDWVTNSE